MGKGFYSFLMHCDTAPFDNNDLRLAMKYAIDRQGTDRVLGGYGTLGGSTYPVNSNYALAPEGIEQRAYDPDKAAFIFVKSGHDRPILLRTSDAAFSGAVDAAVLYQESAKKAGIEIEVRREPEDGYWTNVWNVQPFCASYWGAGHRTQDLRYSTSYLSTAEWNDTRFKREDFNKLLLQARSTRMTPSARNSPHNGSDRARRRRPDPACLQRLHHGRFSLREGLCRRYRQRYVERSYCAAVSGSMRKATFHDKA